MGMKQPIFYVGLHQPPDASQFERSMVSVNRLEHRKSDFDPQKWILDSGAFTRIARGVGHMEVQEYARQIQRWARCGNLVAAVSQDYMCEPFILGITGSTVAEHQRLTTQRYRLLRSCGGTTYIMPVLQGYTPREYQTHIADYGDDLEEGAWVGVGSVCKRNGTPRQVEALLSAIAEVRPDLRLHGFGLKRTALENHLVNELLYSCDSMAWSLAARREGRNANDPREAHQYVAQLTGMPAQGSLFV
jgi:hypothetical protein